MMKLISFTLSDTEFYIKVKINDVTFEYTFNSKEEFKQFSDDNNLGLICSTCGNAK